jgi:hypothetical protein
MKVRKKEKNEKKWKIFSMICPNSECRKPPFEYRVHDANHIRRLHCNSRQCRLWLRKLSVSERNEYNQELEEFRIKNMPIVKRREYVVIRKKRKGFEKPFLLENGKIFRIDGKEKIFHGEVVEVVEVEEEDSELIWARKDILGSLVPYNKNMVEVLS